jgi:threonyl-tRNA synthetase
MVHRALFGSVERFFGVLIEHYAGAFPLWLAPVQVGLVPISEKHLAYAEQVKTALEAAGLRVELDARNEKMNAKIRDFGLQKVPFILILGDKESDPPTASASAPAAKATRAPPPSKPSSPAPRTLVADHAMEL